MKRIVIYVYSEIGIEEIFRVSKEANGSQMGNLEFHPTQRTSTWGYFFYEFWRIGFRVTFGQYYIQLGFVTCQTDYYESYNESYYESFNGSYISHII